MYHLRELKRSDLKTINQWRNMPELISNLGAPFRYINLQVDEQWFESYMQNRSHAVRCAITDDRDNIIGLVSLLKIDHLNQNAELHIMIGDTGERNKGAGTFAVQEIITHGFKNLNLQRIELNVLESNEIARHVYEKTGFVCEGRKRRALYKNSEFVDVLIYAILK